jgi:hypothetical protein
MQLEYGIERVKGALPALYLADAPLLLLLLLLC